MGGVVEEGNVVGKKKRDREHEIAYFLLSCPRFLSCGFNINLCCICVRENGEDFFGGDTRIFTIDLEGYV